MKKAMLLILVLLSKIVFAQVNGLTLNPTLQKVMPPSPEVAAFTKFGNIPVGPSTGIPSVSIPIYEYKNTASGLQLPVTLEYHAGGVRVDEMASRIGIGWALNAGGMVSRTVQSLPDETNTNGFMYSPLLPADDLAGNAPCDYAFRPYNLIHDGVLDSEPDIFSFNFNGHNGRFMLGKNNDLLILDQQKVKIEYTMGVNGGANIITGFKITDESGYIYEFNAMEVTTTGQGWAYVKSFSSAWYITSIKSPSGNDAIIFEYENVNFNYILAKSTSITVGIPGASVVPGLNSGGEVGQTFAAKRIKRILFPDNTEINFGYSTTQRTDLSGDYPLNKITINSETSKRGYLLTHNYITNRLTLAQVTPFGGMAEIQESPYVLEYSSPALPARLSSQQDHWGFYNSNSGGLIPEEPPFKFIFGGQLTVLPLQGGNRDTDSSRCQAGSLKKITYPTGGYTVFDMEPNKAVDSRLDGRDTSYYYSREDGQNLYVTTSGSTVTSFNFQGDPNSHTDLKFRIPNSSTLPGEITVSYELRNPAGTLIGFYTMDPGAGSTADVVFETSRSDMSPGTYTFTTYTDAPSGYYAYIDFTWKETRVQNPVAVFTGRLQHFAGGLRVKKITDYNLDGVAVGSREYEYITENGLSSGTLGVYPVYTYGVYYDYRMRGFVPENCVELYEGAGGGNGPNALVRTSSSLHTLAQVQGSPVTYKRVVERFKNNGQDNGSIIRTFTSFNEVPVRIDETLPFTPPQFKSWAYGKLLTEETRNSGNQLVSLKINTWDYYQDNYYDTRRENFRAVVAVPVKYYYDDLTNEVFPSDFWQKSTVPVYFLGKSYFPDGGRAELVKTVERTYETPVKYLEVETNLTYDPQYYYLKKKNRLSSEGIEEEERMEYPKDMVAGSEDPAGVYQAMLSRNILAPVIRHSSFKGGAAIQAMKTNYYTPFTNVFVAQSVDVQHRGGSWDKRLSYHAYNSKGRVLTASKTGDVLQSYVWGYGDQFVTAEIKNAAAKDCFYTGFEDSEGNSGEADAYAGRKSRTNGYARSFSGLTNGKYRLTYWLKSGGAWELHQSAIEITNGAYQLSISGQIDEVRFHPEAAEMTTYTYNPILGITSISDTNCKFIFYEYDDFGRLARIKDQHGKIVKQYQYQYQFSVN